MLARVVDQSGKDALRLAQVLCDRLPGVASDERADSRDPQAGSSVDAGDDVVVDGLTLVGVWVKVVVVERQRRWDQVVLREERGDPVGVNVGEGLGGDVAGGEGPVAQGRPGGDLQCFETVLTRPPRDVL